MNQLIWLYRLLLRLYPASFQAEFGEEMGQTFETAVCHASQQGVFPLLTLLTREFSTLPWQIITAHWQQHQDDPAQTAAALFRLLCFGVYSVNLLFMGLVLLPQVGAVLVFPESWSEALFVYVGVLGSLAASIYAFRWMRAGGLWMMRLSPILGVTASVHFNTFDNTPFWVGVLLAVILSLPMFGLGWLMNGLGKYQAAHR